MNNLGFKKLTIKNWLEPDEISSSFIQTWKTTFFEGGNVMIALQAK